MTMMPVQDAALRDLLSRLGVGGVNAPIIHYRGQAPQGGGGPLSGLLGGGGLISPSALSGTTTEEGYTAPLPNFGGRPLGFIDPDPGERNFFERLIAGGDKTGDGDDAVFRIIGQILGSLVGSAYGGPIGGKIGGQVGSTAGTHLGSLF